jgi:hypothetical protein
VAASATTVRQMRKSRYPVPLVANGFFRARARSTTASCEILGNAAMRAPTFARWVLRNRRCRAISCFSSGDRRSGSPVPSNALRSRAAWRADFSNSEALSELVYCLLNRYGRHNQFVPLSLQPLKECSEVTPTQSEITHECSGINYDLHPFSPV